MVRTTLVIKRSRVELHQRLPLFAVNFTLLLSTGWFQEQLEPDLRNHLKTYLCCEALKPFCSSYY